MLSCHQILNDENGIRYRGVMGRQVGVGSNSIFATFVKFAIWCILWQPCIHAMKHDKEPPFIMRDNQLRRSGWRGSTPPQSCQWIGYRSVIANTVILGKVQSNQPTTAHCPTGPIPEPSSTSCPDGMPR